jgi:hypothetical protein
MMFLLLQRCWLIPISILDERQVVRVYVMDGALAGFLSKNNTALLEFCPLYPFGFCPC